jgi:REP-associated tyrosine transposase
MFTGRPKHLPGFDYLGFHRYSLTFCTHRRRVIFVHDAPVRLVFDQFLRSARESQFAIIVYTFMPDHVHLLVEGESDRSDGKRFIARAKQYSGYHFAKHLKSRLWQRYPFEHVLRDDEMTLVVAKYILENPVRAGLVERVEEYPFVGSMVYTVREILDAVVQDVSPAKAGHYRRRR